MPRLLICKISTTLLILSCFLDTNAQGKNWYFVKNAIKSEELVGSNEIVKELLAYNCFYFGEQHDITGVSHAELLLFKLIVNNKKINYYFSETPTYFGRPYEELFTIPPSDTNGTLFSLYAGQNKDEEVVLRYLYQYNSREINKIVAVPIDVVQYNEFYKEEVLMYFDKKNKRKFRNELSIIKKMRSGALKDSSKNIEIFNKFYHAFQLKKESFKEALGINYHQFEKYIEGFKVYIEIAKTNPDCICKSKLREQFMYSCIRDKYISDTNSTGFISINGIQHIPVSIQKDWNGISNWNSLASIFNSSHPLAKSCSIYFMNRDTDLISEKYFPLERKLILDNLPPGDIYLVKLDAENTPFINLINKFQYIILY